MNLVPKSKHAIIRVTSKVLNLDTPITYTDVDRLKEIFNKHLHETHMSPREIKELYDIQYTDFGGFLKKCLGLTLKPLNKANITYNRRNGEDKNAKANYLRDCHFKFNPNAYANLPGYDRFVKLGIYHYRDNPTGMCRDHILSKEYGWRNTIPSEIISHPANCQFLSNSENCAKGSNSQITIEALYERIANWDIECKPITNRICRIPKSDEHKANLSLSISRYKNITNGLENKKIFKEEPIPDGYWNGLSRR